MMRKLVLILFPILIFVAACDDGDIAVDDINFENVTASVCSSNSVIYKLSDNQVLLLQLVDINGAFENEVSTKTVAIGDGNQVRYRLYDGTVTSASICDAVQPASPIVSEEWIAMSGTIVINTTIIYSAPDSETGATRISQYRHNITFQNITFAKPQGNQFYETFAFGDYRTTPTQLPLNFDSTQVALCPSTNTIYNARQQGSEGLFISNFDASLLATDNLGTPKTASINDVTNKVTYRLFQQPLGADANENYFCSGSTDPVTLQEWIAVNGTIQVITTTNGGFLHTIRLLGVTFQKGSSTFYYGDDVLYGELQTN